VEVVALILALVGLVLLVTGSVIFLAGAIRGLRARGLQDWSPRLDGFTRRELVTARQAAYAGTLPADPKLAPAAMSLADRLVRQMSVVLRAFPLTIGGIVVMLVGTSLSDARTFPVGVTTAAAIFFVILGALLFTMNWRYLRNARRLLAAHSSP
jgi:hypothetical protein